MKEILVICFSVKTPGKTMVHKIWIKMISSSQIVKFFEHHFVVFFLHGNDNQGNLACEVIRFCFACLLMTILKQVLQKQTLNVK